MNCILKLYKHGSSSQDLYDDNNQKIQIDRNKKISVRDRGAKVLLEGPTSTVGARYVRGSGGMLPRKILKKGTSKNAINASKIVNCDRKMN